MPAPSSRPLSPHLQVYRLPLLAKLSILHRMTGVALFFGTVIWVWWLIAAAVGDDAFEAARWFIGSWLGQIMLVGWTFALFFHLANGIRHLGWDAGLGFELKAANATGWLVVMFALGMTVLVWVAGYIVWLA
ncbi:MAG: succinate dehydrogenase, cytochrome b556 subunit [Alphaproteobacteria bacterium]